MSAQVHLSGIIRFLLDLFFKVAPNFCRLYWALFGFSLKWHFCIKTWQIRFDYLYFSNLFLHVVVHLLLTKRFTERQLDKLVHEADFVPLANLLSPCVQHWGCTIPGKRTTTLQYLLFLFIQERALSLRWARLFWGSQQYCNLSQLHVWLLRRRLQRCSHSG